MRGRRRCVAGAGLVNYNNDNQTLVWVCLSFVCSAGSWPGFSKGSTRNIYIGWLFPYATPSLAVLLVDCSQYEQLIEGIVQHLQGSSVLVFHN